MANIPTILSPQQPLSVLNPKQTLISSKTLIPKPRIPSATRFTTNKSPQLSYASLNPEAMAAFLGTGFALSTLVGPASAAGLPLVEVEPSNALSLPTWAIHVSSVVEWITAMGLVWLYGEKSGYESWKGLSWGMVPLLGGALCACTWHFFYNSESLEVLVALQGALTVIGNATMCIAAFRIYKSSQGRSTDT